MPRSFDSRRKPKDQGEPHKHLRGPKRTGPIGTIVPGDDVEVAREIQRLWDYVRRRKRDCCTTPPDGLVGGRSSGYSEYVLNIGPVGWWRLDRDPAALQPGSPVGSSGGLGDSSGHYWQDVSGIPNPLDLTLGYQTNAPMQTKAVTGLEDLGDGFTTALDFVCNRTNEVPVFNGGGGSVGDNCQPLNGDPAGHWSDYGFKKDGSNAVATVSAWIKPHQTTDLLGYGTHVNHGPIISTWTNSGSRVDGAWALGFEHQTCKVSVFSASVGWIDTPHSYTPDQWMHVCATLEADGICRVYVNGLPVHSFALADTVAGSSLSIGAMPTGGFIAQIVQMFYGQMREVILFKDALTAAEVRRLYQATGDTGTSGWESTQVGGGDIQDGGVDTQQLADGSVTTPKLHDGAVTDVKVTSVAPSKLIGYPSDPTKALLGDGSWGSVSGGTWYSGAGAPPGGTGVDGDSYLNTSNGDFYKKASGSWVLIGNLRGPAGPTGPTSLRHLQCAWYGVVPTALAAGLAFVVPKVGGVSKTFNMNRLTYRQEVAPAANSTLHVETSPGGGAFTPTTMTSITLPGGSSEAVVSGALGTLTSLQLVRIYWDVLGGTTGAPFSVHLEGDE